MPEVVTQERSELNLGSYPDRFLTCRALQHIWTPMSLPWLEQASVDGIPVQVVYERFKCSRCDTLRTDQRTPYGRFVRRHYHHEAGYKMGMDANKKEFYAGERFKRLLGQALETQTA